MRYLRRLLSNIANLDASLLAGAAATNPDAAVPLLLTALATLCVGTWSESSSRQTEFEGEFIEILKRHGSILKAIEAIASGVENLKTSTNSQAAHALEILRATQVQLQGFVDSRDEAVIRLNELLERTLSERGPDFLDRLLDGLDERLTAHLSPIHTANKTILQGVAVG